MIRRFIQRAQRIMALRWLIIHQPITVIPFLTIRSCIIVLNASRTRGAFHRACSCDQKVHPEGLADYGSSMADNSSTNHCYSISYYEELYHCFKHRTPPGLSEGLLIRSEGSSRRPGGLWLSTISY